MTMETFSDQRSLITAIASSTIFCHLATLELLETNLASSVKPSIAAVIKSVYQIHIYTLSNIEVKSVLPENANLK